jgi:hypothetical protein
VDLDLTKAPPKLKEIEEKEKKVFGVLFAEFLEIIK